MAFNGNPTTRNRPLKKNEWHGGVYRRGNKTDKRLIESKNQDTKMTTYRLTSARPYTEKEGKLSFILRGICAERELRKNKRGKWIRIPLVKDFLSKVKGGCGVYEISIRNNKNKKEDICYIGSSKSIPVRLYCHDVVGFLTYYLSPNYSLDLFILYHPNFKSIENKLISSITPFLNHRIPAARIFNIGKKGFKNKH